MCDYVVLFPNGECKEYRSQDRAYLDAVYYHGCMVDLRTQGIICDYSKKQIPEELDFLLGHFQQQLSDTITDMDDFRTDPELVRIRIQMRKLSVMINRYCNK